MRFLHQAELLSVLVASSFACAQQSTKPTHRPGPAPLELKVTRVPLWKGNCLELSIRETNLAKSPIFLDASFDAVEIYSSVSDATNTLGKGSGETWMVVYGWTDVISEPVKLAPGAKKQTTLCISGTFPVKETGKKTLRQVRVQGKLRMVARYDIPHWRIIHQPSVNGTGSYVRVADSSSRGAFGEVLLEIPVPCPNGASSSDCLSLPQIFPGERDVHTFELEPPAIEVQPPPLPILRIDRPLPPKPPS